MEEVKRAFKPEFLNRIDDIIVFDRLTEDNIKEIAKLMLKSLEKRLNANEINVTFTESAVSKIAKSGFDPVYGARPLRRAIQNEIEDMLSEEIIDGNVKSGDSITVDVEDDKFTVKNKTQTRQSHFCDCLIYAKKYSCSFEQLYKFLYLIMQQE